MKIRRMATRATVALVCFAFSFMCLEALSLGAAQDSNATGGLKGQFGVPLPDNKLIIPKETHVWILYGPESVSGDLMARSAWENTAAFQFHLQRERCWHAHGYDKKHADLSKKQLDDLKKEPDTDRRKQEAQALARQVGDTVNGHEIQCTDETIAYISDWARKHPNNALQVKTLTADENGLWSDEHLTPGDYTVIARAHFAGHDALWEISSTVKQGQTQIVHPFQPVMSDHTVQ